MTGGGASMRMTHAPGTSGRSRPRSAVNAIPEWHPANAVPAADAFTIGPSDDVYEREAERAAQQVMTNAQVSIKPGRAVPDPQRLTATAPSSVGAAADVQNVLATPGRPLDAGSRKFFEPRFGHDFSSVRLHADGAADRSARAIDARAYTAGHHIVFAAGQFSPATPDGQRLIAHELAHVAQHDGTAADARRLRRQRTGSARMGTMPSGGPVRQATPDERRDFAREAASFLRGQGNFFAQPQAGRAPQRDLRQILRHLRTTAQNGLAAIANDPAATAEADAIRAAYVEAVRSVLTSRTQQHPGATGTPPTLPDLYEQNRDEILPFAEVDPRAAELSAELTAPLPAQPTPAQRTRHAAMERARQRLRMLTSIINVNVESMFSTSGATMTLPLPANTTARFGSSIPTSLQRGLTNVAVELTRGDLTADTTVMLALDLTPYGGSYDAYRFTRLDLGRLGTEILIERQGAIGVEGLRTTERTQLQQRFDRLGFRRGAGFSQDEFDQVLIAIGEIPEAQLATLGNLRFVRQPAHATNPDAAGDYDQITHTVRLFDRAFSGSMTRFGRPGRVLRFGAQAAAHEIGHAFDLAALRTAAAATTRAEAAFTREFGTGNVTFSSAAERDRFNELQRAITTATTAEQVARSLSGARWTTGRTITEAPAGRTPSAFRQAALADGGPAGRRMPTNYPNPDPAAIWQEYFAESFAMYQTSPDLLRRLRPNVFLFMQQQFPRGP
jgi:hypothetical protein